MARIKLVYSMEMTRWLFVFQRNIIFGVTNGWKKKRKKRSEKKRKTKRKKERKEQLFHETSIWRKGREREKKLARAERLSRYIFKPKRYSKVRDKAGANVSRISHDVQLVGRPTISSTFKSTNLWSGREGSRVVENGEFRSSVQGKMGEGEGRGGAKSKLFDLEKRYSVRK